MLQCVIGILSSLISTPLLLSSSSLGHSDLNSSESSLDNDVTTSTTSA